MSQNVEINGITLTPDAQETLKMWTSPSFKNDSAPIRYVEYLNDTQDFLTRAMLLDNHRPEEVGDLLTKLIQIKDDMKSFIIKPENHE